MFRSLKKSKTFLREKANVPDRFRNDYYEVGHKNFLKYTSVMRGLGERNTSHGKFEMIGFPEQGP